jgi:hypothetical protein
LNVVESNCSTTCGIIVRFIKILLNHFFEFEQILVGDCEKPLIRPT